MSARRIIPLPLRRLLKSAYSRLYAKLPVPWWGAGTPADKYAASLAFWKARHAQDNGTFRNAHFQPLMLAMAGETDAAFTDGKVVADFGCGPLGSLVWARQAKTRIGIDVLTTRYLETFKDDLCSHGMIYVRSTEEAIPLPSSCVDILFTLNAVDHVDNLSAMASELLRILKPGGHLIGSFNIGESPTVTEPQCLTEASVAETILRHLDIVSYRIARQGPAGNRYKHILEGDQEYRQGEPGHLWVRGIKRAAMD